MKFQDYKGCLKNNKTIMRSQQRFMSQIHSVFTEKVNKITLIDNNDKTIQMLDRVISYFFGTVPQRVCKAKLMRHPKTKT